MSDPAATGSPEMICHALGAGAPALVFLHGMGSDGVSSFGPQMERFSQSHRVLAPDLPGHGGSPAGPLEGGLLGLAERVARVVAAQVSGPQIVVGHSLGGILALAMAAALPAVRGVVLIDLPILMPPEVLAGMRGLRAALDGADADPALEGFARQNLLAPSSPVALGDAVVAGLLRTPRATLASLVDAMADLDCAPLLAGLRVPGVFLHAGSPVDLARLTALAPGLRLVSVPDCGHYVQLERPALVDAEIEGLLRASAEPA
jgi:3-oxoadipate enol-lactonase